VPNDSGNETTTATSSIYILGKKGKKWVKNEGKLGAFDGIVNTQAPTTPPFGLPQIAVIKLKVQGATKAATPEENKSN